MQVIEKRYKKKIIETDTFQSFVNEKVYKINHHRSACSDKYLVYLLSCKVCGMKYKGQTDDEFRYRRDNYQDSNKKSLRGEDHKHAGYFAQFQIAGHSGFINDTEIRFIVKMDLSDPTRTDNFWINTLKTRNPQGLNSIDQYH